VSVPSPRLIHHLFTRENLGVVNDVTFCWTGTRIFAAMDSGRVRILSHPSLEPAMFLGAGRPWHGDDHDGMDVDENEAPTKPREFMLQGHTSSCLAVEMQPTARYLATGGADSLIAFWDTSDWLCLRTSTAMVGPVCSLSGWL